MNRLEKVHEIVDSILMKQTNTEIRRHGYVHLYGVSSNCSILALRRGANAELSAVSGMLHDIYTYKAGDSYEHAKLGSIEARKILNEIKLFTEEEINIICKSIYNHSNKNDEGGIYEEILKDADVLQHYSYNTGFPVADHEKERVTKLFKELGIEN
ncbi:HD domain-containing protein [Clostridium folliculivorans]|uniref:Metal-dependent phosphohydrolase n=1 Tax=Clostridium folliculivorans TaxID=2886038 RepID=A0A9W5Y1X0_9CLOT|nr:HD domain-containing protein [Clostridium folliculivorans]GKU25054.1 metal-dependent phosphohydrolase [Clostridium folliculivorans]GKU31152.1 metal-dependent phosphohydrolase [Clostridium folliculivorans]